MIRLLTLAAAAGLIAAPVCAQTVRIPTAGKSAEQVQSDVARAARRLCNAATANATFQRQEHAACMVQTLASVVLRPLDPAPARLAKR